MIVEKILNRRVKGKVKYQEHGSDPRNYRVNFNKVKSKLNFTPQFSIDDGIDELLKAFQNQIFYDVEKNKTKYGNFEIKV